VALLLPAAAETKTEALRENEMQLTQENYAFGGKKKVSDRYMFCNKIQ